MNEEPPVTEAELARVLELDAKATQGPLSVRQPHVDGIMQSHFFIEAEGRYTPVAKVQSETMNLTLAKANADLFAEYRTLTPRLARELAAARAAIKVAREHFTAIRKHIPPFANLNPIKPIVESALTQLNTHTHE